MVATGLGAGTTVGVAAGHIIAQQATAGVADAHSAVAEGFDLQLLGSVLPDADDLLQAQLPGQHHALGTQVIPGVGAFIVGNGLLGGDMALAVGGIFAGQGEGTQIRQDQIGRASCRERVCALV